MTLVLSRHCNRPTGNTRASRVAAAVALALLLPGTVLSAQESGAATVRIQITNAAGAMARATVSAHGIAAQTDDEGRAVLRLPIGTAVLQARRIGFAPDSLVLALRAGQDTSVALLLREQLTMLTTVTVSSTRTDRRVEEEPLRIEVLSGDDVAEKTLMHPADLRTLLLEMPGVRVQTTSPSLGGAAVRILGLRGRYTQILTDGLPLYGAQAGTFGLLQIPPLELRQAEVIKGAASALYGPNSMGGVLNLVTRRPPDSSAVLLNQTARGGTDALVFTAHEWSEGVGATLLAGAHAQRRMDVDSDGWSDIAGLRRIEVRPRLFLRDTAGRSLLVTAGAFVERRGGGSTSSAGAPGAFPESLSTRHVDLGATGRMQLTPLVSMATRLAANRQLRERRFGAQRERERSSTLFGELTGTYAAGRQTLLLGVAAQHESYANSDVPAFDERRTTPAAFFQHTFAPTAWLSTQLNGRCDASSRYGTMCTPRASVLTRAGESVRVRASAAGGWSAPSALTEETEVFGLTRVRGPLAVGAERARTASLDVTKTRGALEVSGTLFASRVLDPVVLRVIAGDAMGRLQFVNATGPADARGGEVFVAYKEEPILLTAFYGVTRTRETSPESGQVGESPYVPRQQAGLDVAFEEDESGTLVAFEVFHTGRQALEDNPYRNLSPRYTTFGVLASQRVGPATVFVNFENLTDVRQSRYDPLLRTTPGDGGRRTVDAWAPLEGRAINAGVRWQL